MFTNCWSLDEIVQEAKYAGLRAVAHSPEGAPTVVHDACVLDRA